MELKDLILGLLIVLVPVYIYMSNRKGTTNIYSLINNITLRYKRSGQGCFICIDNFFHIIFL